MKKNAMLKIAAILMVAVLLTTCAISSTFAKYVTNDTDDTSARVAKWGVTVDMSIDDLFGTTYSDTAGSVASTTEVVAPGTENKISLASQIKGTPEVSVAVTYKLAITLTGFDQLGSTYEPVKFYFGDVATAYSAAEFVTKFNADYFNTVQTFAPGQKLEDVLELIEIRWAWDFDADGAGTNDELDTALGNLAAGLNADGSTPADPSTIVVPKIDVSITAEVVQTGPAGAAE